MTVITFEHLSRWHGSVVAVNDVNATIEPGITALLGPNGSGKSTLLRLAVGLLRPSQGTVQILGQDPWANPDLMRRIGYVPDGPAPWRDLTGQAAVERAAQLSGLAPSDARERAQVSLAAVGLTAAADRAVAGYSHGMQQRVKFAVATVHQPDLLILDEPLLGTDPIARRDLTRAMRDFAKAGGSILLSTHVLPDVEALTDRMLLLDHGRLLAHGTLPTVRGMLDKHPRTVRIATPRARDLGRMVWEWPTVTAVESSDSALTVHTTDPAGFHAQLQALLARGDIPFTSITSPDERLETVFHYLVS